MKKRLISIILALTLLTIPTLLYADDLEGQSDIALSESSSVDLPQSLLPVVIDDPEIIEADRNLRQISVMLASISSPTGNETAADIYGLLYNLIYNDASGFQYLRVYDHEMVVKFNTYLSMFTDQNGNINNPFYSNLVSGGTLSLADTALVVATHLQNLMRMSSNDGADSNFVLAIQDIQSKLANTYTLVGLIHGQLTDQYGMSIANRIANTYQLLFDMHGSDFYYMNNHLTNIENNTSHIDTDLHDIKQWLDEYFYKNEVIDKSVYYDDIYYPSGNSSTSNLRIDNTNKTYISSVGAYSTFSIRIPFIEKDKYVNNRNYAIIYEFDEDINFTLKQTEYSNQGFGCDELIYNNQCYKFGTGWMYVESSSDGHKLYVIPFGLSSSDNAYNLTINQQYKYIGFLNIGIQINELLPVGEYSYKAYSLDLDYVKSNILEHIDSDIHYQNDILDTFKELYASDDLIQAKQAQQEYENQAIEDFTGSGSASASVSDQSSIKSVSGTLKNNLNTGHSVSEGLSVFSTTNGLWGWFSQDNANWFTTPNNNTRSGSNDIYQNKSSELILDIPDYLSQSDQYYNNYGGDTR